MYISASNLRIEFVSNDFVDDYLKLYMRNNKYYILEPYFNTK